MTFRYRIASANCAAAVLLTAMLAALPLTASADAPAMKPNAKSAPKRVLFVGNSYLNFNDGLQNHVRQLAGAADPKNAGQIRYRSATISGGALQDHPIEAYLAPGRLHAVDDLRHRQPLRQTGIVIVQQAGAGDARLMLGEREARALDEEPLGAQQVRQVRGDRPLGGGRRVAELLFAQSADETEEPLAASLLIGSQL